MPESAVAEERAPSSEIEERNATLLAGQHVEGEVVPPTESTEAAVPTESAQPEQTQEQFDFLSAVRQAGFDGIETEADAQRRVLEAFGQTQEQLQRTRQESQQAIQQAQYVQQQWAQVQQDPAFQQFLQQRQNPPKQQTEKQPWWNPPEHDEEIAAAWRVRNPETGTVEWAPDTPAEIRLNAEKYDAYVQKWARKLTRDPMSALAPLFEEREAQHEQKFAKYIEKLFGVPADEIARKLDTTGVNRLANQYIDRNRDWFYEKNPISGQLDPERVSPLGQQLLSHLQEAKRLGIADPEQQLNHAHSQVELISLRNQLAQFQQTQTAAGSHQQHRQDLLARGRTNGAAAIPARGASVPAPNQTNPVAQNPNLSPGQQLVANLAQSGFGFGE